MRLLPSEEVRMLGETARALLSDGSKPRKGNWADWANLGLLGIGLPEAYGGAGADNRAAHGAAIARAVGAVGAVDPFVETVLQAGGIIASIGGDDVQSSLLPAIIDGQMRMALVRGELTAELAGERVVLEGRAALVASGGCADRFIVLASTGDSEPLLVVADATAKGLTVTSIPTVDGGLAADLIFTNVDLPKAAILARGEVATRAFGEAEQIGTLAGLCKAAAAIEALAGLTIDHVQTREQFGQPLGAFQTIQHRVARMAILAREAVAASAFAEAEWAAGGALRERALSSAFVRIAEIGDLVSREAVQMHGAIGLTEESMVTTHFKGVFAFSRSHGGLARHRAILASFMRKPEIASAALAGSRTGAESGSSLALSEEDERFRRDVETFLSQSLTDNLRRGARLNVGVFAEPDIVGPWHAALAKKGWIAPYLSPEDGGTGWSPLRAYLFESECNRAGAPPLQLQGLRMLAPVLLRYGTMEQQDRYLPGILSGSDRWCQGYSEPGAGSDLAALRTRAIADGDDYIVNGSKIWTTQAQHASRMFALVRTSTEGRRQEGLSFLLIDMDTPGITVRPIRTMAGDEEVNEVFFTDVRVPKANRLGAENGGWDCAKYLLEFERGGSTVAPGLRGYFARALTLCPSAALDERIASIAAEIDAMEMAELVAIDMERSGVTDGPSLSASARKLRMSEIRQRIGALAADSLGEDALRWTIQRPLHHAPPRDAMQELRISAVPNAFNDLAYSIFAGSSEIQLSILSGELGLGRPARK